LLITAGAIGNLIDRLHSNCVIDFITIKFPFALPFIGNTFPTFNLADTFITIGIIIYFYQELKPTTHQKIIP
jgi:lipoprotein signal peptidase